MRLFRKDINKSQVGACDKAACWIANGILNLQKKFAVFFGQVSNSWRAKQKWIFLYMVCLVFGGLSIFSVIESFKTKSVARVSAIKVPRNIHKEISIKITDDEYKKVQQFKKSLDSVSLKRLMEERPGLLDSLKLVEQMYYSQKK